MVLSLMIPILLEFNQPFNNTMNIHSMQKLLWNFKSVIFVATGADKYAALTLQSHCTVAHFSSDDRV